MYDSIGEHYAVDDDGLPNLELHAAVEVRIDIEETAVKLFIGSREYEWPRGCPNACYVMTGFQPPLDGLQENDL